MAVASAGPYANLQLALDTYHASKNLEEEVKNVKNVKKIVAKTKG